MGDEPVHPYAADEPTLPAVHALHLAEVLGQWDVPADALFSELGLSPQELAEPSARLSLTAVQHLIERARGLTGEPALGFHIGLQMRASAHGQLGFAAMTSATVREALEVATRYVPTRTTALSLRLHVDGDAAAVIVDELADLGSARDVIVFALLVGLWQIGSAITGRDAQREMSGSAEVAFDEPSYFHRFASMSPGEVRFNQPTNRLVFDAEELERPLVMADPAARRLAREQLERELGAVSPDERVVARAREQLVDEAGRFRSLGALAQRMHISTRTLKRKLAERGTSYSALLQQRRRDSAMLLLRGGELSVEEVAERLGYGDTANFTRAFRRWTGMTPRAYRRGGG